MQHINSTAFYLFLIFAVTFAVAKLIGDNGEELLMRLYDEKRSLSPKETLRLFKSIQRQAKREKDPLKAKKYNRALELLKATDVSTKKCNYSDLSQAKARIRNWSSLEHIVDFLRYYLREQYLTCSEVLEAQLYQDLSTLANQDREALINLRNNVASFNPKYKETKRYLYLPKSGIEEGIASLLRKNLDFKELENIRADQRGIESVEKEYESLVVKPCRQVKQKLEKSMKMLNLVDDDSVITDDMRLFMVKWMENFEICSIILSRRTTFITYAFEELKSERQFQSHRIEMHKVLCNFKEDLRERERERAESTSGKWKGIATTSFQGRTCN